MFKFHYGYMREKYGDNCKLLFTDTDSLCYHVKCGDFYQDMTENKDEFDMGGFEKNKATAWAKDTTNNKIPGKFKDETNGCPVEEFCGIRPKMYSIKYFRNGESSEKGTAKGVQRSHKKKHITHQNYHDCLFNEEEREQKVEARTIRARKHTMVSMVEQKIGGGCQCGAVKLSRSGPGVRRTATNPRKNHLPCELLESTVVGYRREALHPAHRARPSRDVRAIRGTLLEGASRAGSAPRGQGVSHAHEL